MTAALGKRGLRTHWQPLADLRLTRIAGYEALARGPGVLERPDALFAAAERAGAVVDCDLACLSTALAAVPGTDSLAFVNLHPRTLADPRLVPLLCGELLPGAGLPPRRVVLEITEVALHGEQEMFARTLQVLRARGFRLAIDDLGAGYSNLAIVAGVCPDYLKIDRSLLQGAQASGAGRALLETLVAFGHRMGATVVIEGIEEPAALTLAMEAGADMVQGYFIGRPVPEPPALPADVLQALRGIAAMGLRLPDEMTLGEVAIPLPALGATAPAAEVMGLFERRPDLVAIAIFRAPGDFVGLVSRQSVYRKFAWQYGYALHSRRAVADMAEMPLILEADIPVTAAAQALAARGERAGSDGRTFLEDLVGVASAGEFVGILTGQRLLERVAAIRLSVAQAANPLTGLPGNARIEAELAYRVELGEPFALTYIDLNGFKRINDAIGFVHGDALIRALGRLLSEWAAAPEAGESFVGHVGGDDFVAITTAAEPEALAALLRGRFDRVAGDWLRAAAANGADSSAVGPVTLALAILVCVPTPADRARPGPVDSTTVSEVAALGRHAALTKAAAKATGGLATDRHWLPSVAPAMIGAPGA